MTVSLPELLWLREACAPINNNTASKAREHQNTLTKPPGSLGRLEDIAVKFASWQGTNTPELKNIAVRIFAGDHGLCQQNISAFPQCVTAQMIDNFVNGGAAINVLSRYAQADFDILNLGTAYAPQHLSSLKSLALGPGTADASEQPAMTSQQLCAALNAGKGVVDALKQCHLLVAGEMGIGNTASASLLFALLFNEPVETLTGSGTGLNIAGVEHKKQVLAKTQNKHKNFIANSDCPALAALQCCGGFEIAALAGAYLRAAQRGLPILVDGFITTAAWALARHWQPEIVQWSLFAHSSAESAHARVLEKLEVTPLLNLHMRLGEGSGAALAIPLLQQALALHNEMATFQGAEVDASL